jgi:hypothetical protein
MVRKAKSAFPDRIYETTGTNFTLGTVGGGLFYLRKGFINAPRGERMINAVNVAKTRGVAIGGMLAMFGGLFSGAEYLMFALRRKEDKFTGPVCGALTAFLLSVRSGILPATISATVAGTMFAMIEAL